MMSIDEQYMQYAIELARRGEGLTRPNPPVGSVLVQDGNIISVGWHKQAGGDHAERACLKDLSGTYPRATLYVTLEPCSTFGRTPPCIDLIIEKGIGRVVVAVEDRNPAHAGRGFKLLEEAGVEVVHGVCAEAGQSLIAPFETLITTGRPWVTLKLALTLDGKIADSVGDSKWITGTDARERVQAMRRQADAIMVGAGTVRADNPSLLPRPSLGRAPYRVVLGKKIPSSSQLLTDEFAAQTLLFDQPLPDVLDALGEKGIMHLLCEGGGQLATALIEGGYVDEYVFFVAPKLMGAGGVAGFTRLGGLMETIHNLSFTSVEQVGNDICIKAKEEK